MDIIKLKNIFEQIVSKIEKAPETTFEYFKKECSNLTYDEKEVLRLFIQRHHEEMFQESDLPLLNQFYFTEIYVHFDIEQEGFLPISKLRLSSTVDKVQIAKLFFDLKNNGHIQNTSEEIARAVANLFDLKFKTIFSYLNTPDKMEKAKPLLNSGKK